MLLVCPKSITHLVDVAFSPHSAVGMGGWGEARPPKCPQLHCHACRMCLCHGWFPIHQSAPALARREGKTGCSHGTQLASKTFRSAPFRGSPLVFLGGSGRRSLGTLLQWVLPRALQLSLCSQTQSQAPAWQNENCIQAGRCDVQDDSDLPPFCCHMAQMAGRDLCQLVATCPQALLSRMTATKCPQLLSLCPTAK